MSEINFRRHKERDLRFFNDAIEYFEKFDSSQELVDSELIQPSSSNDNPNILRDQMLVELDILKDIITSNPDLKFNNLNEKEKDFFYDFINHYSVCPICGTFNHYYNLKKFYFNDNYASLKDVCIRFMNLKSNKIQNLNLNFGIPCCNCYKKNFELK